MSQRTPLAFLVCLALCGPARAAVEGRVVTLSGEPIEYARVELSLPPAPGGPVRDAPAAGQQETASDRRGNLVLYTDRRGSFRFEEADPPAELAVSHARFATALTTVPAGAAGPIEIRLEPKQQIYEEIAVSADRGAGSFSPVSIASSVVDPLESATPPTNLTELVAAMPGVSENGQGGIFQTYSVRGVSRQRVLTLVSGMRIVGERRAGVSASFVDPLLMGSVDVVRGPSSTFYGSGALGGVVQLFPRDFEALTVETGYESRGDENYLALGWGARGWSLGLARRDAGDAETPAGELLPSAFTQTSATLAKSWSAGRHDYEVRAIASAGRDIGKPNTDFPERVTVYPEESHLLLRFAVRSAADWQLEAWVHPNELETRVTDGETARNDLRNEALDLGLNWQKQVALGARTNGRFGVDYFGRRGVTATEDDSLLEGGVPEIISTQRALDGGEEDELGLYGAVEWKRQKVVALAGGRFAWQRQQNGALPSTDDTALTAFGGLVVPLGGGFELAANLGSGLRFPSLSERFFSGVTGRGFVEGNAALDPERSLNADLGLRWYGSRLFVTGYVFRNEIDDYIERVETLAELLTFVNLTGGTIEGVELDALYQFDDAWSLTFGGHAVAGRDDGGEPLADIPADRAFAGVRWSAGSWAVGGRWEERAAKDDPGSGEKPTPAVSLLSASVVYTWRDGLSLSLSGRNLLDEEYFNSADRRVSLSPGRSVAVGLRWKRS